MRTYICPDKFDMYRANFEDADDHFDLQDIHCVAAANGTERAFGDSVISV